MEIWGLNKIKQLIYPKNRRLLLVLDGAYKGEWLVQVTKTFDHTVFFSLPDKIERIIPDKDLTWGLKNNVLEVVDVLPKKVYNVCIAEYENAKHTNIINRREQRSTPRALGRKEYKDALSEFARKRNRDSIYLFKDSKN